MINWVHVKEFDAIASQEEIQDTLSDTMIDMEREADLELHQIIPVAFGERLIVFLHYKSTDGE